MPRKSQLLQMGQVNWGIAYETIFIVFLAPISAILRHFIRIIELFLLLDDEQLVLRLDTSDNSMPAGIAADKNGHLYVGSYGGGYVMQIDPM